MLPGVHCSRYAGLQALAKLDPGCTYCDSLWLEAAVAEKEIDVGIELLGTLGLFLRYARCMPFVSTTERGGH